MSPAGVIAVVVIWLLLGLFYCLGYIMGRKAGDV